MPRCDKCGKETSVTIRSIFNADRLCPGCKEKERKRPIYEKGPPAGMEGAGPQHNLPGIAGPGKDGINFYR